MRRRACRWLRGLHDERGEGDEGDSGRCSCLASWAGPLRGTSASGFGPRRCPERGSVRETSFASAWRDRQKKTGEDSPEETGGPGESSALRPENRRLGASSSLWQLLRQADLLLLKFVSRRDNSRDDAFSSEDPRRRSGGAEGEAACRGRCGGRRSLPRKEDLSAASRLRMGRGREPALRESRASRNRQASVGELDSS